MKDPTVKCIWLHQFRQHIRIEKLFYQIKILIDLLFLADVTAVVTAIAFVQLLPAWLWCVPNLAARWHGEAMIFAVSLNLWFIYLKFSCDKISWITFVDTLLHTVQFTYSHYVPHGYDISTLWTSLSSDLRWHWEGSCTLLPIWLLRWRLLLPTRNIHAQ